MPSAGSHTRDFAGFPEPEPDSLLLIGSIQLGAAKDEELRRFYIDGLGASKIEQGSFPGHVGITSGSTELLFRCKSADEGKEHLEAWPGQIYIWVADIQRSWVECKDLSASFGWDVVEQELCCKDENRVDALVLRDPAGVTLVVNQAPKGFPHKGSSNLIGIMDVLRSVPLGAAAGIARFYKQYFSAGVSITADGLKVHFAAGDALRQTLTFQENASAPRAENSDGKGAHQVVIYMPSKAKFQLAFVKLNRAGVVQQPDGGWLAAEKAQEFSFRRCLDPSVGEIVLDLEHVVRSPEHPDCPLNNRGGNGAS